MSYRRLRRVVAIFVRLSLGMAKSGWPIINCSRVRVAKSFGSLDNSYSVRKLKMPSILTTNVISSSIVYV